jgi:AraC-like DNA-binding protein
MVAFYPQEKVNSDRIEIRCAVIRDILPWIEEILSDERVRVKTITDKSGYGHWHFQRVFRAQTGYNLAEYIRVRRIARAAYSVAFTDKEIIDIALENGFTSQQNFSRTFKKYLLLPPTLFRKACSGRDIVFRTFTRDLHKNYAGVFF